MPNFTDPPDDVDDEGGTFTNPPRDKHPLCNVGVERAVKRKQYRKYPCGLRLPCPIHGARPSQDPKERP
jgi:hypothetical protein